MSIISTAFLRGIDHQLADEGDVFVYKGMWLEVVSYASYCGQDCYVAVPFGGITREAWLVPFDEVDTFFTGRKTRLPEEVKITMEDVYAQTEADGNKPMELYKEKMENGL